MIDVTLAGGACPARPITYALPRAMRYPHAPLEVPLDNCELSVASCRGDLREVLDHLTTATLRCGVPFVLANFDDVRTTCCRGLCLFMPTPRGVLIGWVEPCVLAAGMPMILVSADRTRAFAMSADGKLVDCEVPRPARAKQGIARGWGELIRRMNASVTCDGRFLHSSYELHLTPMSAAALG